MADNFQDEIPASGTRGWARRNAAELFGISALLVFLVIVLWPSVVYTVPPGHVGVQWKRFAGGTLTDPKDILPSGIRFILPWDRLYIYDARLRRIKTIINALTKDGLDFKATVYSRYSMTRDSAGYLHQNIGEDYELKLVEPALRSIVISYVSKNEIEDLYSGRRADVETRIVREFQAALRDVRTNSKYGGDYVQVEDVLLEEIVLPELVRNAIQEKDRIKHMSEAYEFRLRLENQERIRKRIEAEGIRSFQEIVAPGITPSYLRWRGIEATLKLSQSNNSKVVIIGSGRDGLPVILNTDPGVGEAAIPRKPATGLRLNNSEQGSLLNNLDSLAPYSETPSNSIAMPGSPSADQSAEASSTGDTAPTLNTDPLGAPAGASDSNIADKLKGLLNSVTQPRPLASKPSQ